VKTPNSTIASYFSTVKRASRDGTQSATGERGCLVIVDMGQSPRIKPVHR
jgi:hypothetical protein